MKGASSSPARGESRGVEMTSFRIDDAAEIQDPILPEQHVMVDIEAPAPPTAEWDGDDDEYDGCLLDVFTAITGTIAGCANSMQSSWFDCGLYLRERRFWICKIIIVMMDAAILRGTMSMGAEYCAAHDEISEFGWILWSTFLVFCKFVYLRPVFHVHQLGVFHGSRADAGKSAFLEFLCFLCHANLLFSFAYRAVEPGFAMYISGSCASRGKTLVQDIGACSKAMRTLDIWEDGKSIEPQPGLNRTASLSSQPPGCYYTPMEGNFYFNPVGCNLGEDWCNEWISSTFGQCTKTTACVCECSMTSMGLLISVLIFFVPMPLQWRMFESSLRVMMPCSRRRAAEVADDGEDAGGAAGGMANGGGNGGGDGDGDVDSDESDEEGAQRLQQEGGNDPGWPVRVEASEYAQVMEPLKFGEMEGLRGRCSFKEEERDSGGGGGPARGGGHRMQRLHKELSALPSLILQHPNSSTWVRYDSERPQHMRVAITGPVGTPYEAGIFFFDVFCPDDYPHVPPRVRFLTTARGTVRFNPNLYNDGKVCLSLLGTFDGPRWDPSSTINQVLMSIQGMILGVAHPLYNEPGLGGFGRESEGAAGGGSGLGNVSEAAVRCYDERTQLATLRVAIIAHIRSPPAGFEETVRLHLLMKRGEIMQTARRWLQEGRDYRELNGVTGVSEEFEERMEKTIEDVRRALEGLEPTVPVPMRAQIVESESEAGAAVAQNGRGSRSSSNKSSSSSSHGRSGEMHDLAVAASGVGLDLVENGRGQGGGGAGLIGHEGGGRREVSVSDDDEGQAGCYDEISDAERDALENDTQSLLRSPGAARRA